MVGRAFTPSRKDDWGIFGDQPFFISRRLVVFPAPQFPRRPFACCWQLDRLFTAGYWDRQHTSLLGRLGAH